MAKSGDNMCHICSGLENWSKWTACKVCAKRKKYLQEIKKCAIKDIHCHDNKDNCIPFISNCKVHAKDCSYDCHEECECKIGES